MTSRQAGTVMRRTLTATLTLALSLGPGAGWAAAQDEPMALTPPSGLTCQTYETSEVANDPFAFGAIGAISCPKTESEGFPGIDYLTLFRFPHATTMAEYWAHRREQNPRMSRRSNACADGKKGSASWQYGDYFCYLSRSGSHALLRWTDERTNTYGVLDANNARLAPLHRAWLELRDGVAGHDEPAFVETYALEGLPPLRGYTTDEGVVVLHDEDFCAYILDGIWGEGSIILSELVFANGPDARSVERAMESYAHQPRTDEYALERCVRALNEYRLRADYLLPLPWWAHEEAVMPEAFAALMEPGGDADPSE